MIEISAQSYGGRRRK